MTAVTWAAYLKDCMIELHNTSRNPFKTNPYPQKPLPLRDCETKISSIHNCDSAIGLHLLQNDECAKFYNDLQFSILAEARTPFHLAALEATYIKIHQQVLCRHKEFVYALQISHNHVIVLNVREISSFRPINVQCTTAIWMFSQYKDKYNFLSCYSSDNS